MTTPMWRKSSHSSDGTTSQCVEIAQLTNVIGVRDSKRPGDGHLKLTVEQFALLVQRIKDKA